MVYHLTTVATRRPFSSVIVLGYLTTVVSAALMATVVMLIHA